MTSTVQCDFCPNPKLGLFFTSPGVSEESETLRKQDIETQKHDLQRTDESQISRICDAGSKLIEIYKNCRKADWDGRDALPIPRAAIAEAEQLIALIPKHYPMPDIIPEPSGEVGFEWYIGPYRVLLLSIAGDGYINYAGLYGFKDADYGSKPLTGKLNKKIVTLLEDLFEDAGSQAA